MDNIIIVGDIMCATLWGVLFGMNTNRPGIIKWLDAAGAILAAGSAIFGVLGI